MPDTHADAMEEGRKAYREGKSLHDCPYRSPDLAAAWQAGMKQASRDAITTSLGKVVAMRRMPKH